MISTLKIGSAEEMKERDNKRNTIRANRADFRNHKWFHSECGGDC